MAIRKADDEKQAIVLSTQLERNVIFYSRLYVPPFDFVLFSHAFICRGFSPVKDVMFPPQAPKELQFRCWFMKREVVIPPK
jgi:hypothetical protein